MTSPTLISSKMIIMVTVKDDDLGDDGDDENVDDGTGKPGEKVVT